MAGMIRLRTHQVLPLLAAAALAFLKNGDHMLMADTVYGPSRSRVAGTLMARAGIETSFLIPQSELTIVLSTRNQGDFYGSPGSLTFEMMDIPAICAVAKDRGVTTIVDNTWSSPYFCQPIALGVDVVCGASTKYVVGHSDVMMGTVTVSNSEQHQQLKNISNALGYHAAPDDCYLALRGLRTIAVRLPRHQQNALKVAKWLQERPEIREVRYPALPDAPGHAIWQRDHSGASGLFSVVMAAGDWTAGAAMIDGP